VSISKIQSGRSIGISAKLKERIVCSSDVDLSSHVGCYFCIYYVVDHVLNFHRHLEVQDFIYETVQFSLNGGDLEAAYTFLRMVSRDALHSIRTINIHWCAYLPLYLRGSKARRHGEELDPTEDERKWEGIWNILFTCSDLQSLYVKIFDQGYLLFEDTLLKPLNAVNASNFMVQLPWPWGFQSWYITEPNENYRGVSGEGCNFKIIRPESRDTMVARYVRERGYATRGYNPRTAPIWRMIGVIVLSIRDLRNRLRN
jgi:hypothetical protein